MSRYVVKKYDRQVYMTADSFSEAEQIAIDDYEFENIESITKLDCEKNNFILKDEN